MLHYSSRTFDNKRTHSAMKKVLFYHDDAPAHSSTVATANLNRELLPHPS